MSDSGATYRTREEIQRMCSTQSPTRGLQRYIEEWGLTSLQELRQLDKEAKAEVDQAIEEAKTSPARRSKGLWTDIYDKGPPFMRGRERKEPLNNNMTAGGRKMSDPYLDEFWLIKNNRRFTTDEATLAPSGRTDPLFPKGDLLVTLPTLLQHSFHRRAGWSFGTANGVTFHLQQPRTACHLWEREYISFLGDPTLDGANAFALHSPNLDLAPMDDHFDGPNADYDIPEIGEGVEVFAPTTYAGHFCRGEHFEGAAIVYGIGDTFLRRFDMDRHAFHRQTNMYYPFANFGDWEMANFLLQLNLSMREVDNYLSLSMTKKMPLSFWTAKELRGRIEDLPKGPCWKVCVVPTRHPTTNPVQLYWRDSLECIEALFNHPFYAGKMDYSPFRVFTAAERVMRVYSEWMSSDRAWDLQTKVPVGSMLCGVILSSDKTNITNVCGGKVAHPLLISLANIRMNVRNKGSSHAFLLTALMPITEFIYPVTRIRSVLEARLFHACLDFVLEPLKKAAQFGRMMADPLGNVHFCFTPLVSYIVDTPEACMLACVRGKTSPVTKAMYKNFGDPFRHGPRTGEETLRQLESIPCDPDDVEAYFDACAQFRLSGVSRPFWRDWLLSDPHRFLTLECLHHWHRMSWDHDVKWCLRQFKSGITKLKQVGGRTQRDVQRYLVVVIAGAAHPDVVAAVCALTEFRYLAQAPAITEEGCEKIAAALAEFHHYKQAIIDGGLRRGDQNTTEHAHIEVVKDPASRTNNKDYSSQICRHLDRVEKCWMFDTAVRLRGTAEAGSSSSAVEHDGDQSDGEVDHAVDDVGEAEAAVLNDLWAPKQLPSDFFKIAAKLLASTTLSSSPLRTFVRGSTAFHLNFCPTFRRLSVDAAVEKFAIPDLRSALGDYLALYNRLGRRIRPFGGARQSAQDIPLPFEYLQIWYKVRIQQRVYHDRASTASAYTIHAQPPNGHWKYGRYDAAILQVDEGHDWPDSGLTGFFFDMQLLKSVS
ncbi:hypothetical protein BKA83DRAFT_4128674 [Pisolithus microcarpus]|nr:hypothetical protein BKA83DRAFT_4128674 [Pisolithus microcarpus]